MAKRAFDVILYGASGFTGKLCVEYMAKQSSTKGIRWAIAGRNGTKLEEVKADVAKKLNLSPESVAAIPVITASSDDLDSLKEMAKQATVVLSTAGPFAKIGTPVVDACVDSGTNYVDITGESVFVRNIIDTYHDVAVEKKLKIIPCCGFDCTPVDMGCDLLVETMKNKNLEPKEVRQVLIKMKGGASGGTIDSVLNMFDSYSLEELKKTGNPFYLNPRLSDGTIDQSREKQTRIHSADRKSAMYDSVLKKWCVPFIMQAIDTRVINRSNAIGKPDGWKYGKEFIYTEGVGASSAMAARITAAMMPIVGTLLYFKFTRPLIRYFLPKSGEGPTEKQRETGMFYFKSWGRGVDKDGNEHIVNGKVLAPNGDGGYKQTSIMVCESAMSLAMDHQLEDCPQLYGVLTPSTGLGKPYRRRLEVNPGISFEASM